GAVKNILSGTWLGHALRPALSDVPIGAWVSAMLLDLFGDEATDKAAQRLVGIGILAAVPTAASGLSDWADTGGGQRRVGLVHASANTTSLLLYSSSWFARRRGNRGLGAIFGFAGGGATLVGAYLGGHLSYAQGVGVDQTVFDEGPDDWSAVATEDELTDRAPKKVLVNSAGVLLYKDGDRIYAIASRCSHLGGPLEEGEIRDHSVVCPWHASAFSLADGAVIEGPARSPQPPYDVRAREGKIEIRVRT
ncbi:MAG: Rieske 2Fe-2S domain-containing protein, partial [Actinobacteria bacterium]|nr:Rieske 2Fe-2S domain-containing protein [Actinomycetota bacterium]